MAQKRTGRQKIIYRIEECLEDCEVAKSHFAEIILMMSSTGDDFEERYTRQLVQLSGVIDLLDLYVKGLQLLLKEF